MTGDICSRFTRSKGCRRLKSFLPNSYAGGKFNKNDGSSAYRFGGLHGVGVSARLNALSTRLEVEVVRDGSRHRIVFAGERHPALQRERDAPQRASGTRLRIWPDAQFFDAPNISLG